MGSINSSIVETLELREAVVEERKILPPNRAVVMFNHEKAL